jgi:[ribosomal protein S18]-alanine N-acetyltransferase
LTAIVFLAPACIEDIESISAIEAASFTQPWQPLAIMGELTVADSWHQVARVVAADKKQITVAGYILVRFLTDEMHIMKLAVDPRWRKHGTATALLEAAQQEAVRRQAALMLLEVRPSNRAAIGFYRKAGFQTIGIRPNYYPKTGEDALVMSKRLKEEP